MGEGFIGSGKVEDDPRGMAQAGNSLWHLRSCLMTIIGEYAGCRFSHKAGPVDVQLTAVSPWSRTLDWLISAKAY